MTQQTIQATATNASTISTALDTITEQLMVLSKRHNISQTMMLCYLKDYCDQRLVCPVD